MNKRGISGIVTAVGLVALSLVAGSLLAGAVFQFTGPALSPALSCTQAQLSPPLIIKSTCYNIAEAALEITLERPFNAQPLTTARLQVGEQEPAVWDCGGPSCTTCTLPNPGETTSLTLPASETVVGQPFAITASECALDTKVIVLCPTN